LTEDELVTLTMISRARSEPADRVARAKILLTVAAGATYGDAAAAAGRRSNDAVSHLVHRFNQEGVTALDPRHGGGPVVQYDEAARRHIVAEARRAPDRNHDGTATWSLTTLQRALRTAPDGFPHVSTFTIWKVLHEAQWRWQRTRTWCETGTVQRIRKTGMVTVTDPETEEKKG
jgi:transposase